MINLENVLLVEDKLWTILESFRFLQHNYASASQTTLIDKQGSIALLCEDWWEITHEDNLNYLDRLFRDQKIRRTVRQSIILELLCVTVCYAVASEKASSSAQLPTPLQTSTITDLKNMFFYVH